MADGKLHAVHANCVAVDAVLAEAGVLGRVRILDEAAPTAAAAADLVGTAKLSRATPEFVYAATGQRIGGVAPVAHPRPLPTIVDTALADFPQVWAAGGIPHAIFPTTFDELVRLTRGQPADVA